MFTNRQTDRQRGRAPECEVNEEWANHDQQHSNSRDGLGRKGEKQSDRQVRSRGGHLIDMLGAEVGI